MDGASFFPWTWTRSDAEWLAVIFVGGASLETRILYVYIHVPAYIVFTSIVNSSESAKLAFENKTKWQ